MGERPQMDNRRTARSRSLEGSKVQQILPLDTVKTRHLVAASLQEGHYRDPDIPAMPRDQNAHPAMIPPGQIPGKGCRRSARTSASNAA
jgi:hypothetical protein